MVSKWSVQRIHTGSHKPWRAFAPEPCGRTPRGCRCKSFQTWAEALTYARDEAAL